MWMVEIGVMGEINVAKQTGVVEERWIEVEDFMI